MNRIISENSTAAAGGDSEKWQAVAEAAAAVVAAARACKAAAGRDAAAAALSLARTVEHHVETLSGISMHLGALRADADTADDTALSRRLLALERLLDHSIDEMHAARMDYDKAGREPV
jgi:hypothetical protein